MVRSHTAVRPVRDGASFHDPPVRVRVVRLRGANQIGREDAVAAGRIVADPSRSVFERRAVALQEARATEGTWTAIAIRTVLSALARSFDTHGTDRIGRLRSIRRSPGRCFTAACGRIGPFSFCGIRGQARPFGLLGVRRDREATDVSGTAPAFRIVKWSRSFQISFDTPTWRGVGSASFRGAIPAPGTRCRSRPPVAQRGGVRCPHLFTRAPSRF